MENAEVARTLSEMGDILELTGGSAFKARAYHQAARLVESLPTPVSELWRTNKLKELPGIGEHMVKHIGELVTTGTFREYHAVARRVPPGVLEMLRLEGLGPKTVAGIWKDLGIEAMDALENACRDGSICKLPRMGPKRAQGIVDAITRYRARAGRVPLSRALPYAETLAAYLRDVRGAEKVEPCGSVRRRVETVGDLDILVSSNNPEPVMRAFLRHPDVAKVVAEGTTRSAVRLKVGLNVDLRVVPPESWGAALHYFTGSKAHNIAIRTRAVHRGLKLSEYGVFDRKDRRLGGSTEEEVFRLVGLPFIPPELREASGEIEAAEAGRLPTLVEEADLMGDLHVHSKASSDAHSTLHALYDEAKHLGRHYLAITDHSRSRPLGLDAQRLRAHAAEIRQHNHDHPRGPRLLAGVEVDILANGALDLPIEELRELDCVVASIHSHFHDPPERMTDRVIRAMRSGVVDVIGHPTGRQLGARDAYQLDLERIMEVAREEGVALEVNAMPDRMDLHDRHCRLAKEKGVPVVIDSDAHHASHLAGLQWGVWMARRGWLEADDVLTTRSITRLRQHLRRHHPVHKGGPPRRPRGGLHASHA
ncbi:MAG: DNA polymerase/3'-5' exonuclease PolX [Myxococcota bacterium]